MKLTIPILLAILIGLPTTATADTTDDPEQVEHPDEQTDPPPISLTDDQFRTLNSRIDDLQRRARAVDTDDSIPVDLDDALRQVDAPRGPEQIFDWIDDNIELDFYVGSYRGARGTLIAAAGNAADQALLAHQLLERAGHDSRFVTGRLHQSDAEQLVDDTVGAAEITGVELELNNASIPGRSNIIRNSRDHIWLEVTDGDRSRVFDPVAAPTYGMTPASADEQHDRLPQTHRTDFEMTLVSHLDDGRTLEHLVVDADLADLAFESLTLGFEPDPTRPGGRFPLVAHGDRGLRGDPIPVAAAERIELQFRFRTDQLERRWEQMLYRQGQGTDIFEFDHQHFTVSIAPGFTSETLMRHNASRAITGALEQFSNWGRAEIDDDNEPLDDETRLQWANAALNELGAALPFAVANALDEATLATAEQLGIRPFMTRPRIITTAVAHDGEQLQLDLQIDGDRIEALPKSGISPLATAGFLTSNGLLRDRITGEFIDAYTDQPATTVTRLFRLATRQSIPFVTIDARTTGRIDRLDVDEATREALRHDVTARNMTVLAPLRPVEDADVTRFGWWALNPHHGYLEGHTTDAVLAVDEDDVELDGAPLDPAAVLSGYLDLVARHLDAAEDTADDPADRYTDAVCDAAAQFRRLARAFCATRSALPLPDTNQCLADPPEPAPGLLASRQVDCRERLAPFRCAAVVNYDFMTGNLTVSDDEESNREPLCR